MKNRAQCHGIKKGFHTLLCLTSVSERLNTDTGVGEDLPLPQLTKAQTPIRCTWDKEPARTPKLAPRAVHSHHHALQCLRALYVNFPGAICTYYQNTS